MLGPGHVRRPALVDRIGSSTARVVIVRGPAGFGKSTVVVEWLRSDAPPRASRSRVPWSATAPMTRARFWESMLTTVATVFSLGEDHPVALLRTRIAASGTVLAEQLASLAEAIAGLVAGAVPAGVDLVLDALDLVTDHEEVEEELRGFLRSLPWLRLVVVSRARTTFERPVNRLEWSTIVIGPDELRFGDDEIAAALGRGAQPGEHVGRVSRIVRATERVPVLVRLAALELEGAPDWSELPAGVEQRLRRHLVETVLRGSAAPLLELGGAATLLALAGADHVVSDLAEQLTGHDGHALIDALERLGLGLVTPLVVGRLDGSGDVVAAFDFSPGIREALAEQARTVDREAWLGTRAAFARWAHGSGLPVEALEAAIDAQDHAFASRVVTDYFFELQSLNKGTSERVLAAVPARTLASWPVLAAARALDNFGMAGRQWRTGEYFALAALGITLRRPSAPPTERLLYTAIEMMAFRLAFTATERARRSATRAAAAVAELTPEEREELRRILPIISTQIATTLLNTGDPVGAALSVTEAQTASAATPAPLRYSALSVRAGAHALAGRLTEAGADLAASEAIPGMEWRHHNVFGSPARIAEAVLHLEAGDALRADRALERLREHYPTIENLHLLTCAESWLHLVSGTAAAGYEIVLSALADARLQRRLAPFVVSAMHHHLAVLALADGRLALAQEHAQQTEALEPFTRSLLEARLALALQGPTAAIRRIFDSPPKTDATTSPRQRSELALLRLASALRSGNRSAVVGAGTQALALLERHRLRLPLLVLDPLSLHALAEHAGQDERLVPLAELAAPFSARLPGWASAPLPRLTPREREVFEALVWTASAAVIAESLGTSTNTVKKQLASLYRKLGVSNRAGALEYAQAYGIAAR